MTRWLWPFIALTVPAAAQAATLGLPHACTAFVTVQTANCSVSHYVTCSGDPMGQKYAIEMDSAGSTTVTILDAAPHWLQTVDPIIQTRATLQHAAPDWAPMSELLTTGEGDYTYVAPGPDGVLTRYLGHERLTGAEVTIDGVPLLVAEIQVSAQGVPSPQLWSVTGTEYVSPEWLLYLGGPADWVTPDQSYASDTSPVSFDFPGDPGFLTTVPVFGCAA